MLKNSSILFKLGIFFFLLAQLNNFFLYFDIKLPFHIYFDRLGVFVLFLTLLNDLMLKYVYRVHFIIIILFLYFLFLSTYRTSFYLYEAYQPDLFLHIKFLLLLVFGYNFLHAKALLEMLNFTVIVGVFVNFLTIFLIPVNPFSTVSISYETQYLLIPALFLIFLPNLPRKKLILYFFSIFLYLVILIMHLKRLPFVRVLVILLFYSFFYFKSSSNYKFFSKYSNVFILIFFLISAVYISNQTLGLFFNKFVLYGSVNRTVQEDQRLKIGDYIISDLKQSNDLVLGRGFGGVVFSRMFHIETLSGTRYRSHAEMAFPTILLKGGYVLLFLLIVLIFFALRNYKVLFHPRFRIFYISAFIWTIFMYLEGYFTSASSIYETLVIYSFGFLLNSQRNIRNYL